MSAETAALFRGAAIAHAGARRHGAIVLVRPLGFSLITLMYGAVATAIIAFLVCFSTTRKAQVQGVLLPSAGLIRLLPAQPGIVSERRVHEGQQVQAGEVLFVLSGERASAGHASAEQAVSSLLQARRDSLSSDLTQLRLQASQRIDAARLRGDALGAERQRIDAQIELQQRRVALAQAALARYADLQASGFVASAQVQDKQSELMDQQQRSAELERTKAGIARDALALQAELRDLPLQALRDQQAVQRSIAALEQDLTENAARREIVVRAPMAGSVTAIAAEPGQSVAVNQAIAALVPSGSVLEAELHVPSRSVGFIKAGMPVLLRYQAYPFQKFGLATGTVREVSSAAMRPQDLAVPGAAQPASGSAEPLYRVRVKLDRQALTAYGVEHPLRPGAALDASVVLEKRRLIEWVLDPLHSVAGSS